MGVFRSEIKNKEADLYLCSKGFPTAEIFLLYRCEGSPESSPWALSRQTQYLCDLQHYAIKMTRNDLIDIIFANFHFPIETANS